MIMMMMDTHTTNNNNNNNSSLRSEFQQSSTNSTTASATGAEQHEPTPPTTTTTTFNQNTSVSGSADTLFSPPSTAEVEAADSNIPQTTGAGADPTNIMNNSSVRPPTQPQAAEMEASILKLFNIAPDDIAAREQLLAAAMGALTAANNGAALSPQEQVLASMAPTLSLFGGGGTSNNTTAASSSAAHSSEEESESRSTGGGGGYGSKKRRKQSKPVRYGDDIAAASLAPGQGSSLLDAVMAMAAAAASANSSTSTLSSSGQQQQQQQHINNRSHKLGPKSNGSSEEEEDEDDDEEMEEDEATEFEAEDIVDDQGEGSVVQTARQRAGRGSTRSGTVRRTSARSRAKVAALRSKPAAGGAPLSDAATAGTANGKANSKGSAVVDCGGGNMVAPQEENDEREEEEENVDDERKHATVSSVTRSTPTKTAAGTLAPSATSVLSADNSMQFAVDDDDDQKQQLLLANVLANFQQKYLQQQQQQQPGQQGLSTTTAPSTVSANIYCPQCNFGPCSSDEQLRMHIEHEHMAKFSVGPGASGKMTRQDLGKLLAQQLGQQQPQQPQQQPPSSHSSERKRKRSAHSSRSNSPGNSSISSAVGVGDNSSQSAGELEEGEVVARGGAGGGAGGGGGTHPKDMNHNNLLRAGAGLGLHNLPANLISPLISSLSSNNGKASAFPTSSIIEQLKISTSSANNNNNNTAMASPSSSSSPKSTGSNGHEMMIDTNSAAGSSSQLNTSNQQQHQQQFSPQQQMLGQQQQQQLSSFQQFLAGNGGGPGGPASGASFPPGAMLANGMSMPGLRIFNLEAYCELCNKEFCNKYFLKTHKANKHGIYTFDGSNSGSNSTSAPTSTSNTNGTTQQSQPPQSSFASVSPTRSPGHGSPALSQQQHLQALAVLQQQQQQQSTKLPVGNGGGGNAANSRDAAASPGSYGQPLTPFTPPMRLNLNMAMVNLDSYCEICQKEFCNKYFLKKHKQKIHGYVYQGETAIPPSANSPQMQHIQQLQMLQQQLAAQQQHMLAANRSMSPNDEANNIEGKTSLMLGGTQLSPSSSAGRPQSNPSSLLLTPPNLDKMNARDNSSPMSAAVMANLASSFAQHPAAISALTSDRLRQMGVINADAFCEICCKEFCNKYFLRTHKINKHGISDPSQPASATSGARNAKESSPAMFPTPNGLLQQQQQQQQAQMLASSVASSAAANRQVSGNASDGGSADGMLEPGQRDPTSYGKSGDDFLNGFSSGSTASGALKCDLCPQAFPNSHLMRMHKFYSHNLPYGNQEDEEQEDEAQGRGDEDEEEEEKPEVKRAKLDTDEERPKETVKTEDEDEQGEESNKLNGAWDKDNKSRMFDDTDDSDVENDLSMAAGLLVSAELNTGSATSGNERSEESSTPGLQRLRSMVKDLPGEQSPTRADDSNNNIDGSVRYLCHSCRFICESRYHLRAHFISEHGFPASDGSFAQLMNFVERNRHAIDPEVLRTTLPFSIIGNTAATSSTNESEAFCELCNKEFCSKYFLKNHKKNIHGICEPERASPLSAPLPPPPPAISSASMFTSAMISGLYSQANSSTEMDRLNLAIAMQQQQQQQSKASAASSPGSTATMLSSSTPPANKFGLLGNNNNSPANNQQAMAATIKAAMAAGLMPETNVMPNVATAAAQVRARGPVMTGRNYCNICNKELCNKYFMKTHMLKMHGINIDEHPIEAASTSTIGGVQCDICQKELCSKYFLKVHKQNTHGIYEDGSAPPMILTPSMQQQQQQTQAQQAQQAQQQRLLAAAAAAAHLQASNGGQLQQQQQQQGLLSMSQQQGQQQQQPPQPSGQPNDPSSMLSAMMAAMAANNSAAYAAAMAAAAAARSTSPTSSTASSSASSSDTREVKAAGVEPEDVSNRHYGSYQEACRFCDRRFKSIKWVRLHMMNEHQDSFQIMRTLADLAGLLANATGGSAEQLVRLCFECGQTFPDQISAHVHALKEHKMPPDQMALNMITKFGIMTAMINANNSGVAQPSQPDTLRTSAEMNDDAAGAGGHPSPPMSPQDTEDNEAAAMMLDEKAHLQALFLKNSNNLNLALAAAAASGVDIQSQFLSSFLQQQNLVDEDQQQQQHHQQSVVGKAPKTYPCRLCPKTYRQSHSLQRHMIVHKNELGEVNTAHDNALNELFLKSLQQHRAQAFATIGDKNEVVDQNVAGAGGDKPRNKRYRCSKCNKKFRTRELCLLHIRTQHSATKKAGTTTATTTTVSKETAASKMDIKEEEEEETVQLPLSPSATSSEGGEHHQHQQQQPGASFALSSSLTSQPTSVINFAKKEEEDGELEEDEDDDEEVDTVYNKTSTLDKVAEQDPEEEEEEESSGPAARASTNSQLICINGEQF